MYEKHGYSAHPLYFIRLSMINRCYNSNDKDYKYYGGRGIGICEDWLKSPKNFIEWCLANGWKKGLEIDRIDNNKDYSPDNCRFITHTQNVLNQKFLRSNNTSGVRGVKFHKKINKWQSQITINKQRFHLGYYKNIEDAKFIRDSAAAIFGLPTNTPVNNSFKEHKKGA